MNKMRSICHFVNRAEDNNTDLYPLFKQVFQVNFKFVVRIYNIKSKWSAK
jgi:hypothetical protein